MHLSVTVLPVGITQPEKQRGDNSTLFNRFPNDRFLQKPDLTEGIFKRLFRLSEILIRGVVVLVFPR